MPTFNLVESELVWRRTQFCSQSDRSSCCMPLCDFNAVLCTQSKRGFVSRSGVNLFVCCRRHNRRRFFFRSHQWPHQFGKLSLLMQIAICMRHEPCSMSTHSDGLHFICNLQSPIKRATRVNRSVRHAAQHMQMLSHKNFVLNIDGHFS